jgi:acyl-coenzyme A thioesterase PaaI-like protein
MLATIDFSVKLLAPAIGDRFVGRGQVISAGKSLIVTRADAFALGERGESQIATGLVTMRAIA